MDRINNFIKHIKKEMDIPYELFINYFKNEMADELEYIQILTDIRNTLNKMQDIDFNNFIFEQKAFLMEHNLINLHGQTTKEYVLEQINLKIKDLREIIRFKTTKKKTVFNNILTEEDFNYIFNLTKEEYENI